jgi:hypothetical protein
VATKVEEVFIGSLHIGRAHGPGALVMQPQSTPAIRRDGRFGASTGVPVPPRPCAQRPGRL